MSAAELDPEIAANATLKLLETRLHRLEFLLTGNSSARVDLQPSEPTVSQPVKGDVTVAARLQKLQTDLEGLRNLRGSAGDIVRDVESLNAKAPEIFAASSAPVPSVTHDLSTTTAVVLSYAPLFPEAASRLSSLQSLQIPSAEQSNKLISLNSRIESALQKQAQIESEAEDLRQRSAKCLEWWVRLGVVGMGELWEDWESRVQDVDRSVKRLERRYTKEDGYV